MSHPVKDAFLCIRKPENGIFYIHHKRTDYKFSLKTTNRKIAEQKLICYQKYGYISKEFKDLNNNFNFVEEAIDFYRENKSRDIDSIYKYLKIHFGKIHVDFISQTIIDDYIKNRRIGKLGEPAGEGTIRKELRVFIAILKFCVSRNRIDVPTRFELPKEPTPKDITLSIEECTILLKNCADDRIYLFCLIGLYTGARKQAILDLKWGNINFQTSVINFNGQRAIKTKKNRPIVPMHVLLHQELLKRHCERGYVLGSNNSIEHHFKETIKKCNFNKNVTPHTLRHTFATLAVEAHKPIWTVAKILGNTVAMTEARYAHYNPTKHRDAVNIWN